MNKLSLKTRNGERPKIVHMAVCHQPSDTRILYKQCRSLARAGAEVYFIVPYSGSEVKEGVNVCGVACPESARLRYRVTVVAWRVFLRAVRLRGNIYQVHEPWLLPIALVLKLLGKKVIYDAHENYHTGRFARKLRPSKLASLATYLFSSIEKSAAARMNLVLAATEEISEAYPTSRAVVVRNFAVREMIDSIAPAPERPNKPVLIYPGTLGRSRGIKELIASLPLIDFPVELWLMGNWRDRRYRDECMAEAGWMQTRHWPYMDASDLYARMKCASLGFQLVDDTSDTNGPYPMKVFEFMACSLPVIITDQLQKRKTFGRYGTYVYPISPDVIARAVTALISNKSETQDKKKLGRKMFESNYSWESEEIRLITAYQALLC